MCARVCVCARAGVFAHVHVAQSGSGEQRVRDTRQLNGTGTHRGLQDNVGLTDPTKWAITSQRRELGRKKNPQILPVVILLDQWTHKNTYTAMGGVEMGGLKGSSAKER